MSVACMNQIMEPHSHIEHNRREHIEFYMKNYVPIAYYVVQNSSWFSYSDSSIFIIPLPFF